MDKILLLEDYEPSRILLNDVIQEAFEVNEVLTAGTVAEAFAVISSTYLDLAVLDLNLPDGSGIEVIRKLRELSPDTLCVVATVFDDDQNLFESLKAGAHGYLLKEEPPTELVRHLEGILQGRPPLSASMAGKMIAHFNKPADSGRPPLEIELTSRELDVLDLIAKGAPRKTIARTLNISIHTANDHVKAVYRKLKVSSSVEAARIAIEHGLSV